MATSLPYLLSYRNLSTLFDKINSAKVPEEGFTHKFLQTTIGLKATSDRAMISLLRHLGFIDQSSLPTSNYRLLKGDGRKAAIAQGIRKAYQPLFDADQDAHKLNGEKLKSLIAQVAGTDSDITSRTAGTFSTLVGLADFDPEMATTQPSVIVEPLKADIVSEAEPSVRKVPGGLRTEFHYNIQVHLPSNGTEETYLNIFNAIRKTFQ